MNPEDYSRDDLTALGVGVLSAMLVINIILWFAVRSALKRFPHFSWRIAGAALAGAGCWAALQILAQTLALATSWPLLGLAIAGGISIEWIVGLYQFERTLVSPGKGRFLLGLRFAALIILLLILAQPVRSFLESREIEREVAILVDESDSMLLADQRLNASERLDRAALSDLPELAERPPLREISNLVESIDSQLADEVRAFEAAPSPEAAVESRVAQLTELIDLLSETNLSLNELLEQTRQESYPDEVADRLTDYHKRSRDGITRILGMAKKALESSNAPELLKQIKVARTELESVRNTLPTTTLKADDHYYRALPEDARSRLDQAANTTRLELARRVLESTVSPAEEETQEGSVNDLTLLSRLSEDYNLRFYRYAQDVAQFKDLSDESAFVGSPNTDLTRTETDLTNALEHVLNTTAPESLAGVLLLSDGRSNSQTLPEDSLRQLAVQNTPLSAVPVGSRLGPIDLSILDLKAPESIYLDDRVVVGAEIKADGLLGETIEAELLCNGAVVETQTLEISDVDFRSELRFVHRPEKKGILDYQIFLKPDESELFKNNNIWDFKVAVTDDRTNVLLVDGYPRWEFRYLRNLFYGRDKSVHLQYVLMNPDEIYRAPELEPVYASASRPFGEAEATKLPRTPEEWQLFDVIILGDIKPDALSSRDWQSINEAVTRRGAMLVCVAGARYMPHAHSNETLQTLLPINYTADGEARFDSPEPTFKIELTSAGQSHAVTSQSSSRALNLDRWNGFQPMQWRFVADGVKETAEVLAFARPTGSVSLNGNITPDGSPGSVEAAIEQLANRKTLEQNNAVISTIRAGLGKVLFLNSDQSWRFRYGVGDTYHHRFWGQVMRWGAGPNLRSGGELIRLGSDRLSYTPDDPVTVTAKVLDAERRPVTDAEIEVEVWKDGVRLNQQRMSYRSGSSGLYETSLPNLIHEGNYELRLAGEAIDQSLAANPDGPDAISTELLVVSTRNPIELAELTADRDFLNHATQLTGGRLAELHDLESLLTSFGAPKEILTEQRNITLWDTWPMLLAFLGFLTTEWIVRRRSGLV